MVLVFKNEKSFCSHSIYDQSFQLAVTPLATLIQSMQKKLLIIPQTPMTNTALHKLFQPYSFLCVTVHVQNPAWQPSCCFFQSCVLALVVNHPLKHSACVLGIHCELSCSPGDHLNITPVSAKDPTISQLFSSKGYKTCQHHLDCSSLRLLPTSYHQATPQRIFQILLLLFIFQTRSASACFGLIFCTASKCILSFQVK